MRPPAENDSRRAASDAVARARDLLSLEDEQLTARLDDVERGTTTAELDEVLGLVAGALAGPNRLRPLEYRKLVALQTAARARRAELAQSAPPTASPPGADPAGPAPTTAAPAVDPGVARPVGLIGWLGRLVSGPSR